MKKKKKSDPKGKVRILSVQTCLKVSTAKFVSPDSFTSGDATRCWSSTAHTLLPKGEE